MIVSNIDEVVQALDAVVLESIATGSRLGYFAALYRQVTLRIKRGIHEGMFDDPDRMARFDTIFANRYLVALEAYKKGVKPSKSWNVAFECTKDIRTIILQHLLLGINAHVNLDLGIAAAEVAPGAELPSLEGDFEKINDILASLIDPVQVTIGPFSPFLDLLDRIGETADEKLINFSMDEARAEAWNHARMLADQVGDQKTLMIDALDRKVAFLARVIKNQPPVLTKVLELIGFKESQDVPAVIHALNAIVPPV